MPDDQRPTPPSPTLKVLPETVELSGGDVQAFSVSNSGLVVDWSTQPQGLGQIDAHGIYRAPDKVPNPRSVVVLAVTPGGAQYGTATVTLSDAPRAVKLLGWYAITVAVLLGLALVVFWRFLSVVREPMVVINPPEITLDPKQDQDIVFDAIVLGDLKNGVTWSASDGNIDISKGIYKRPKKSLAKPDGDDVTITATSLSDQNVRNTAELHLRAGQQLLVHPSAVSVFTSQQVRFRAEQTEPAGPQAQASDQVPEKPVKWRLDQKDLGVIDEATGVYTAPRDIERIEPFEVIAESASGARSAAVITVNPAFGQTDWKLIVFVIVMGSLGSMIYFSSSFVAYVGNRSFRASWLWFYISRPFVGGALAVIFFLIAGGGFLNNRSTSNLMAIGVIAALVGLFSDRAVKKLSDIFDVVFAVKDDRVDKLKQGEAAANQARADAGKQGQAASPKITSTEPPRVTKNRPATLTVRGSNFNNYKIQINDDPPIDPSNPTHDTFALSLTADQTKGDKVTITVINGDKATTKFDVTTVLGGPNGKGQVTGGPVGPKPLITASVPATLTKNLAATLTVQGSNFKNYKVKVNGESVAVLEPKPDSFKVELTAEQTEGDKVVVTVVNGEGTEASTDIQTTEV